MKMLGGSWLSGLAVKAGFHEQLVSREIVFTRDCFHVGRERRAQAGGDRPKLAVRLSSQKRASRWASSRSASSRWALSGGVGLISVSLPCPARRAAARISSPVTMAERLRPGRAVSLVRQDNVIVWCMESYPALGQLLIIGFANEVSWRDLVGLTIGLRPAVINGTSGVGKSGPREQQAARKR